MIPLKRKAIFGRKIRSNLHYLQNLIMHLVIDNPIIIRVHVMVKGLTIIQPKFDMEKTLGLGVELGQCSTSQVCPLLFVPRHVMAYYIAFIVMKKMILLILRKAICLNKRILLLLRKVVCLFCFGMLGSLYSWVHQGVFIMFRPTIQGLLNIECFLWWKKSKF